MPDADTRGRGMHGWSNVFAAMPQETPPADGWSRFAASLPPPAASPVASARGVRRVRWAWAATLALAAGGLGLAVLRVQPDTALTAHVPRGPAPSAVVATGPDAVDTPIAFAANAPTPTRPANGHAMPDATSTPASTRTATDATSMLARDGTGAMPGRPSTRRGARPAATVAAGDATLATVEAPAAIATSSPLDALRSESARLESLVALAHDDRMSSGPAAILAADAADAVRAIDFALSQPTLDAGERLDLWTQRVAALRELAGLETTNRWLAANGESLQGAIALVD